MEDFLEIAKEMQKEKDKKEYRQHLEDVNNGEHQYTFFKCWCNAFNNGEGQNDANIFARYLKEQNIELTFWQKKHIAETYFGYEYTYDYDTDKWSVKKRV